ncbi:SAM-dependent methyltransferase YafE [Caballeronia sordidicola]|uniref:SAM-dependent methyltransferase YafE n=1 Tax=Caballeronia sordidicola TaxID=196367 RepID=A0A242M7P7_CABSO|nr:SAM-dependent methyltransferase YafE [Caballeronia sordidicola]
MKHHDQVADAFGSTAAAYLTSAVHATGADLQELAREVAAVPDAVVLDLGCGAGHVSFSVAPHAKSVVAYDIAEQMLATVAGAAQERGLENITTQQGPAERLPFADAIFDRVLSRMSAHLARCAGGAEGSPASAEAGRARGVRGYRGRGPSVARYPYPGRRSAARWLAYPGLSWGRVAGLV